MTFCMDSVFVGRVYGNHSLTHLFRKMLQQTAYGPIGATALKLVAVVLRSELAPAAAIVKATQNKRAIRKLVLVGSARITI